MNETVTPNGTGSPETLAECIEGVVEQKIGGRPHGTADPTVGDVAAALGISSEALLAEIDAWGPQIRCIPIHEPGVPPAAWHLTMEGA